MAAASKGTVVLALIGNSFLTVIKFVAFFASGSGTMLSEAIHSVADTANQGLLFLGIRRSERAANAMFPYGYGADRYVYSLLSAVGIFVLGCGVTIYHGIHTLLSPPELSFSWITWVVLAISLVVDAVVLMKVVNAIKGVTRDGSFLRYLREATDPTVLAVLFEDGVAVLGVLVAATCIGLSWLTGSHIPDAIGSLLIGVMLGAVAVWLGIKNRQLILGQAISRSLRNEMRGFILEQSSVSGVRDVMTRVLGADAFRLKADVSFNGRPIGHEFRAWVASEVPKLTSEAEITRFSEEFGEKVVEALGDEIDRIEAEMVERFPGLMHLDLEAD